MSHWSDFLSQRVDSSRQLCALTDLFTDQKPKMKVSSFINRLHLCTFDWQKMINKRKNVLFFDEFSLRKDDRCCQVKDETKNQSTFCSCVVPPSRIKRNSTIFDGYWHRVDAQRKISEWQLFSLYYIDLFNFIPAKHKAFDASIFNDNPMTKSLAEESIENNQRFFSQGNKTKRNTFSSFEHFYPKRKQWKDLFISTQWNRWKTIEEKRLSRSFKFGAAKKSTNWRWKSSLSSVLLNCETKENLRQSKIFSSLFWQSISNKRFSNQTSNEKIFSNSNFQNLLEEEKSDEQCSNQRHSRQNHFSSSNLFQNSTNLQVMNVVLPVNFSSNPTIKLRLKHDDWLFCLIIHLVSVIFFYL